MKSFLQFFIFAGLLFFYQGPAVAQGVQKADTAIIKMQDFPPLEVLIDSALNHNPLIHYRDLEIDAKEANLISQQHSWLRNLGVQGDSRYGNIDAFSTNANGVSTSVLNTASRQLNYAAGVYIKIPVFDIVNRKTQVNQARSELKQAGYLADEQREEIRQLVIRQYHDVLLKQKILVIKASNLGSAMVNMEMIEKEFRNGIIPVTEYVRITDIHSRIQADYETARSDFLIARKMLEETVGFVFNNPTPAQP